MIAMNSGNLRAECFDIIPSRKKKRTVGDILATQAELQRKHRQMVSELHPAEPVPYVDGGGRQYRYKVPSAPKGSLLAPALPEVVRVLCDSGVTLPSWRRYAREAHPENSHVVLVEDLATSLYKPVALLARLHGLRLADKAWVRSKMNDGACICFAPALEMHLYVFLADSFSEKHPEHADILMARGSLKRLVVRKGLPPPNPKHPRLTFLVTAGSAAGSSSTSAIAELNLESLLEKLTSLMQERSVA